jgi:hypothetical protein
MELKKDNYSKEKVQELLDEQDSETKDLFFGRGLRLKEKILHNPLLLQTLSKPEKLRLCNVIDVVMGFCEVRESADAIPDPESDK